MKPALSMLLEGIWYSSHGDSWEISPDFPVLSGPCRILTDFDGAPAGVMAVDTKPEFAPSMIEKRVRSEGLVDGEAHVLTHNLIYAGGSSRVLYTAVPVTAWNEMFAWLDGQSSMGLVFSIEAAMLALAQRYGAVMCRVGRQFRFLVSQPDKLSYVTTTAFSDDQDDLDIALINLMDRAGPKLLVNEARLPVFWCDLLASQRDDGARLVSQFSQRMGVKVVIAPVQHFDSKDGPMRTAVETMMDAMSWRAAVNPLSQRIAAIIDQFSKPIAAAVALVGLSMFAVSTFWISQTIQIHARIDHLNQQINTVLQHTAGQDSSPDRLLVSYAPTIAFLDSLTRAAHSPDLLAILADIRQAADKRVRVMRIQLSPNGAFRVDGMPINGATDAAISGFLAKLKIIGYRVTAMDPGGQSQLPGFFSYSVQKDTSSNGVGQ